MPDSRTLSVDSVSAVLVTSLISVWGQVSAGLGVVYLSDKHYNKDNKPRLFNDMYEEIKQAELQELVQKLNSETARIAWSELQTFFASGMTVYVSHKLDLIKVACELAEDNKAQIEDWMQQGMVANVSDEQASAWLDSDIMVWATVIHPWVLVQPVVD